MKIGVIGVGDIAKKAYLPVLTQTKELELHVCTRNKETLKEIKSTYQLKNTYTQIDDWLKCGMEAAFVHSSTDSHEGIIDTLLDHNIHVYVDKPITYEASSTKRLINKAKDKGLILMVGFNRRYAPSYQKLKEIDDPNMVLIQKNRGNQAEKIRTFIFDDFIHVIDTLLYLFPYQIENVNVRGKQENGILHHIVLQLEAKEGTAIGIMNRESGTSKETVEVHSPKETRIAENVNKVISQQNKSNMIHAENDWEPTLNKRGFRGIVDTFLNRVEKKEVLNKSDEADLRTHLLAEEIIELLK